MSLNARITAKLDAGIDADLFERCAVALMANHYENVVGIEGGSDGGRDGDIIAPIAGEPDSRGRILVTTGDSLSNLKSSHKTWDKFWNAGKAFRVDLLVMVTSKNLSDTKRRHIETYCETHKLPVPQIYARQWLVESLRRDPELRVELTGVEGRLEALTTKAPEPSSSVNLYGRDGELERLRTAITAKSDVSLLGMPGIGKSRLLAELEDSVHFVDPLARDYLVDDLFAMEPTIVVLDDAHLDVGLLEHLIRIRRREQLDFTIIAAAWPGTEATIEALLENPARVWLDRLARAHLDLMIQALGVHGNRARFLVLDQSDGRPGWAVMLSRLVVDGAGDDLASGQSLLDQVAGLATTISGNSVLNDALASIAALGVATLEDIEVVASHSGVAYAELITWLEATAQGGLIGRTRDNWSVLAPLRSLIVASTFFGERKRRRWDSLAEQFLDDDRLDRTILDVATKVPDAEVKALADTWFTGTSTRDFDAAPLDMLESYSCIDENAADRAAKFARTALASPRERRNLYGGVAYQNTGSSAEGILRTAFRRTCSGEALHGLLDLAIADDRPRHQFPDHPIRVIQGMAHYLDPDLGTIDNLRERILRHTLEWFDGSPDEDRWQVLAEVAGHVFDPSVEGNWSDPGSHLTVTIASGVMSPEAMNSLLALWDGVDSRVRADAATNISHGAVAHLCGIFDSWSALSAGVTGPRTDASTEHYDVGLRGAELVLNTLMALVERFPAIPIRVNTQLALVTMWSGGSTTLEELEVGDDRLARFVGTRDPDGDVKLWMAERREQRASLAREIAEFAAHEGIAEYGRLVTETSVLQDSHEGDLFVGALADQVHEPGAWLEAAVAAHTGPLVAPLVARARADGVDIGSLVISALEVSELRPGVLRAFTLEEGELDDLAHTVIDALTDDDLLFFGELWALSSATPMLRELLVHRQKAVRSFAAISFGEGIKVHGPALPEELRSKWRLALIETVPEKLPHHSRWRFREMIEHAVKTDPELCTEWFIANAENSDHYWLARLQTTPFTNALHDLPQDQKRRIVEALGFERLISSGYAGDILGTDSELAASLLAEGAIDGPTLLRMMSGYRDQTVEALAPALVSANVAPNLIVARALRNRHGTGAESVAILADLEFFAELGQRQAELAEVCALATEQLTNELERATAHEHQERLRGW